MRKLWLVARFEYLTRIKERSFLISTASVPLVLLVAIIVGHAVDRFSDDDMTTIGYVDRAGIISEQAVGAEPVDGELLLRAYADEDTARADLDGGEIDAYYVVPAEYPASGDIELFALTELPKSSQRSAFVRVVRSSLLADQPAQVRERILEGSSTVARLANSRREVSEDSPMAFLVSMFGAIMLSFCIMTSGMQMLHAISTEKENRVIEVLFLSLSPRQMIGGKALGLIALFVTQLTVWVASLVIAALAAQPLIGNLGPLSLPWGMILIAAAFFLPTFALAASIMIAIGSMMADLRQAQQLLGIINLLFLLPVFAVSALAQSPDHISLVVLSFLPTSAFVTLLLRWPFTIIPYWQIAVSWLIVVLSSIAGVWFASKAFSVGALSLNQRLSIRRVIEARAPKAGSGVTV